VPSVILVQKIGLEYQLQYSACNHSLIAKNKIFKMTHTIFRPGIRRSSEDFNRHFGEFFHKPMQQIVQEMKTASSPAYANISETETGFNIQLAVPGFSKEDIQITLEDNKIKVSGKKEIAESTKFVKREFNYSTFERVFTLPEHVNADQINASSDNGILSIVVPKPEVKSPLSIKIQ
jgi:HSP20 family protein